MGRLEELEIELNRTQKDLEEAVENHRHDDIENLHGRMERIESELRTYDDTWVPQRTDTDYNELA
ncbi:MAG: hypothetical protein LIO77_02820 [Rikenellaceae bacterium]|nr:hypothetical protein [Rikenellaceae bacterium]